MTWWRRRRERRAYRRRLERMTDRQLMRELGRSIEIAITSVAYELEKRRTKDNELRDDARERLPMLCQSEM